MTDKTELTILNYYFEKSEAHINYGNRILSNILNFNLNAEADMADLNSSETATKAVSLQNAEYESRNFCHFKWDRLKATNMKPQQEKSMEILFIKISAIQTER